MCVCVCVYACVLRGVEKQTPFLPDTISRILCDSRLIVLKVLGETDRV